jgi:kinesin family protein 4/21/27
MGTGFDVEVEPEQNGIIARAVDHVFQGIQDRENQAREAGQPAPEFSISAQFIELYNEEIIDLFGASREHRGARVSMRNCHGEVYKYVQSLVVNYSTECYVCIL